MNCPAEFVWAQYVDEELPENEARELTAHLESCSACQKLAMALNNENQLLVQSLQDIEYWKQEPDSAQQEIARSEKVVGGAAIVIGAAIFLRAGAGLVLNVEGPSVLDWLSPLSLSGQLNWLANALFYLLGEGRSMMAFLISRISFIVLGCLLAGALIVIMRRIKGFAAIVSLAAIMLALVVPGYAIEVRKGELGRGNVTVSSNQIIDDTLVVFADSVDVRGTVTGDLVAFARRVNIRGTVQGNVIGFGQRIEITGNVGGDIFGFGQDIQASGSIGHNLWGFGQNITVDTSCRLPNDATLFGSDVNVEGAVGRDLTTLAGTVDVGNEIGRDFQFRGARLLVRVPTVIGRNLSAMAKSANDVQIDPGVVIKGKKTIEWAKPEQSKYLTTGFYFGQLLRIAAAFLMGLLLFWLFPRTARAPISTVRNVLKSGGIGFLAAVATPIASVILAITLIGLPIALTALALWILCLYLAKILIARSIGNAIFGANGGAISTAVGLLIGIVIVAIAVNLPYIGGLLNFILILIGFGGLVSSAWSGWLRRTAPPADAAV